MQGRVGSVRVRLLQGRAAHRGDECVLSQPLCLLPASPASRRTTLPGWQAQASPRCCRVCRAATPPLMAQPRYCTHATHLRRSPQRSVPARGCRQWAPQSRKCPAGEGGTSGDEGGQGARVRTGSGLSIDKVPRRGREEGRQGTSQSMGQWDGIRRQHEMAAPEGRCQTEQQHQAPGQPLLPLLAVVACHSLPATAPNPPHQFNPTTHRRQQRLCWLG